jgi:hypothetical protein
MSYKHVSSHYNPHSPAYWGHLGSSRVHVSGLANTEIMLPSLNELDKQTAYRGELVSTDVIYYREQYDINY